MEEWPKFDDKFLLGIDKIDGEHRRLFDIAQTVFDSLGGAAGSKAVSEATQELIDYTATHFASEEAVMAAAAYPELDAHREQHRQLITKVRDMEMRAELGDQYLPLEMSRFLLDWMVGHIQTTDKKFGEYAAARKAK